VTQPGVADGWDAPVAPVLRLTREEPAETLDRAADHLVACGLALAGMLRVEDLDDEVAGKLRLVIEQLDTALRDLRSATVTRTALDAAM
jgi:hypothetical protein